MPVFNAPSGLQAEIRKLRGRELIAITEETEADDHQPAADGGFGSILGPSWLRTIDPGPYKFAHLDATPDFTRVLKGDLIAALVFLRMISLPNGEIFTFKAQCEKCRHPFEWDVNLKTQLPVQELSHESIARMLAAEPFTTIIPSDGRKIFFHLQTISQEPAASKVMKSEKRKVVSLVDRIAMQISAIEGCNPDLKAIWNTIADLDLDDLYTIRQAMDAVDCGLETSIEIKCTKKTCKWVQWVNLPLDGTFFAPSKGQGKDGKSSSKKSSETDQTPSQEPTCGVDSTSASGTNTEDRATA